MENLSLSLRPALRDMQRVLITTDTIGGVWHYTIELAGALRKLGVEPIIAALGTPPAPGKASTGDFSVFFFSCRLEWMQDPWEDVRRSGDWLLRLADHLNPDLVHLNGFAHAARSFPVPVLVVGHSCVYSWYQAVKGRPPPDRWHPYRHAVAAGLAAAQGVTAPTGAMLAQLERHYGSFKRLAPIANGRRAADFPTAAKEPFILSAGRLWDEAKNIAGLAQIANRLDWPVLVAGEERHPEGGRLRHKHICLLGFLNHSEFSARLSKAAIYALPAFYEPFGLTVLEAGLAGCALVLGDIPSLRETWDGAAFFVPPERIDLLQAALDRLIDDEKLRLRYARKARQRALTFTAEKMARKYVDLYHHLLGREEKAIMPGRPEIA